MLPQPMMPMPTFFMELQPFTEPVVRPATMCRCAAKNITMTGTMVSVMKASTVPVGRILALERHDAQRPGVQRARG